MLSSILSVATIFIWLQKWPSSVPFTRPIHNYIPKLWEHLLHGHPYQTFTTKRFPFQTHVTFIVLVIKLPLMNWTSKASIGNFRLDLDVHNFQPQNFLLENKTFHWKIKLANDRELNRDAHPLP